MKRSLPKLLALGLTIFLVAAVALVGGIFIVASTDWARNWVLQKAQAELEASQGMRLEVESASGSLLHHLELKGVRLSRDGQTMLTLAELELEHNLPALLGGRLKITRLVLKEPAVTLPWKFAESGGGQGAGFPLAVTLEKLHITGGSLYPQQSLGPLQGLSGLKLSGAFNLDSSGLGANAQIKGCRIKVGGLSGQLGLKGKARLKDTKLTLSNFSLTSGGNEVKLQGRLDWARALKYSASIKSALSEFESLPMAWPGSSLPQASINLGIEITGTDKDCRISGQASLKQERISFSGDLGYQPFTGKLKVEFDGVDGLHWGLIPASLQLDGRGQAEIKGLSYPQNLQAKLKLSASRLEVYQVIATSVELAASLKQKDLSLESLKVSGDWGEIQGRGKMNLAPNLDESHLEAAIGFTGLTIPASMARHVPEQLRRMSINGSALARGKVGAMDWELNLAESQISPDHPVSKLQAKGAVHQGLARLSSLDAALPSATVQVQGLVDTSQADASFHIQVEDLHALTQTLAGTGFIPHIQAAGALEAHGKIKGPWQESALELQATAQNLEVEGVAAQALKANLQTSRLTPTPYGKLVLDLEGLFAAGRNFSKVQINSVLKPDGLDADLDAQGEQRSVSLHLTSPDPWQGPRIFNVDRLNVKGPLAGLVQQGRAQVTVGKDELSIKGLTLASGSQSLQASGAWHHKGNIKGDIRLQKIRLAQWIPGRNLPDSTRLSASAQLSGTAAQPRIGIDGQISGLKWSKLPEARVKLQGNYADRQIELRGNAFSGKDDICDLKASAGLNLSLAPFTAEPGSLPLNASVISKGLPLRLLQPLLAGISDLDGRAKINLTASGEMAKPQVQGDLQISGGRFAVNATAQEFNDLKLKIKLREDRITVEKASLASGGVMEITGWLDVPWSSEGGLSLDLKADNFLVSLGLRGQTDIEAGLALRGNMQAPKLSGEVKPKKVKLNLGSSAPADMEDVVVLEPGQIPPPLIPEAKPMIYQPGGFMGRADLNINVPVEGLEIAVGQGSVQLGGGVRLLKKPQEALTYNGTVSVAAGVVIVQNKRFQISQAIANFQGRDRPDPDLDAKAFIKVGDVIAWITVAGTATSPNLQFTSEPAMSQADVISTIIFGKPTNSLSSQQSASFTAQALALVGSQGAERMRQVLGPALAPDVVTVHSDASGGSSLEAGKYISPDLYLRYRTDIDQDDGQNLGLEYKINRHFSVESQVGTTRDTGMDIIVDFDFD